MRDKWKRGRRGFLFLALGILICCVLMGAGITVRAKGEADVQAEMQAGVQTDMQAGMQTDTQTFHIDAQVLPSGKSVYEIQLKIENKGQDWTGIVRLMTVDDRYGRTTNDCAYDTELSLPQGSTKQFTVKVPKDSLERTDGLVQVTLLDEDMRAAAQKEFGRLLQAEADALTMGILSDEYTSLTYLDMGGSEFYYNSRNYPIRLEEMTEDRLKESLTGIDYLVIDSYNTGILSEKALGNVLQWIDQGGVLILGTGSRADEVLAGLDELGIQCVKVNDPGEDSGSFDYVDGTKLSLAELEDGSNFYTTGNKLFKLMCSWGDGAVGALPFSLAEAGQADAIGDYEQQKDFVEVMLRRISSYANFNSYGRQTYDSDSARLLQDMCNQLGSDSAGLQFGGLKLIVILYVIFVGPVLYLILCFTKKRDFYWLAVPIAAFVGIILIYWAGRGFEVVSTKVYSVTIENLSGGGEARTYLRCYDAGHKEWRLRLAEGYEYAGPLQDSYYQSEDGSYYYRIQREGDRLFLGMNPSAGFADGYFHAGAAGKPEEGAISGSLKKNRQKGITGTVKNETGRDFKYFAVSMEDGIFVYKNLPAGAEVNLEEAEIIYDNDFGSAGSGYYGGIVSFCYAFLMQTMADETKEEDINALAALGLGLVSSYRTEKPDTVVIAGVVEDWDKTIDDNCSEVSYGCLYAGDGITFAG
ncbi:MAG: hypothetical protein NC429_15590 [Lachnospiraceae bacterium]|nr:hypothetical protein [Lachnospiraceae bacterium]